MLRSSRKPRLHGQQTGRPRSQAEWKHAVPASLATPKKVFVTCHYCSYSPSVLPESGRCPKCGGQSWQRYALSRRLLEEIAK